MKRFVCAFILSMLPAVSANALEIKMNEKIGEVVSGTVLTDSKTEYETVVLKAENESGDTIYLNQIYTDSNGSADFKFIHNPNKSGYGTMTLYATSAGAQVSAEYTVEESSTDQYISVECLDLTTDGETSSIKYKITNNDIYTKKIFVATAVYKSGVLDYIQSDEKTLTYGQMVKDIINVPYALDSSIKTFVWDAKTFKPYCEPIVWEKTSPEPIKVEAENSVSGDFTPLYLSGTGVSGKLAHLYKTTFNPDIDYYNLTYNVNCAAAGIYDVIAVISNHYKGGYTADCCISVNSGEPVHSSEATLVEELTVGVNGLAEDQLGKYSFGQVYLARGRNTLELKIEGKNWMNNSDVFQADYFEFVPVKKNATTATLKARNATLNIFEKKRSC